MSDYRASAAGRRQSWFGLKKHVKRFFALPVPHAALRVLVRFRPQLRRGGRLPAPARLQEVRGRTDGVTFTMLRPDRCEVAKELYWGNGRLPKPADAFALDFFTHLSRDADVLLDIGAYTGIFTLASTCANPHLHVHAFELIPDICELLRENCERNGVLDRVSIHNIGVGKDGASMLVPASSMDSALPSFYSSRMRFESGVTVEFRSLDAIANELPRGSRVIVKVDVEGTENDVFRNGQAVLSTFRPDILCEVLHGVAEPAELQSLLEPHGYRFNMVRDLALEPRDRIVPDPAYRDWLFSTREL